MKPLLIAACALALTLAPAAAADGSDVQTEAKAIVAKIQTKLKDGKRSEKELITEINEFDALVAKHASEKTDEVAAVLLMKAMLYLQVFDDTTKGTEILDQLKTKFAGTRVAAQVDTILDSIQKQAEAGKVRSALKPGALFPDFAVTDLDGKPLSVSALKGKVVLIDFWATWCGPCVAELPSVLAAYEKFHGKGFEVIGISLDKDKEALTGFLASKKIPWPQFFDGQGWKNKLAVQFGISSIPATYLLDKNGVIIASDLRGEALEKAVAKAVGGN